MADTTIRIDSNGTTPIRSSPLLRGFIQGAASLFDIFRIGTGQRKRGTPDDDARALRGDVEQIAQDFHTVLSGIDTNSKE